MEESRKYVDEGWGAGPRVAMVLAAGLGKRMRPLADDRPKPMIEVAGKSLIDHTLDRLAGAGISSVVVNLHYRADMLEAHLRARMAARPGAPEILFSDERERLLETGGGVKKAGALLGSAPFFVLNSDMIWTDGPDDTLALIGEAWRPADMDALMLMVPAASVTHYTGRGDFAMDGAGRLTRLGEERDAPFIYGGIQILHPRILDGISEQAFSLNRAWDSALEGGRLYGIVHAGQWMHVGTPGAVTEAEDMLAE